MTDRIGFAFPGYVLRETQDTGSHFIEVGSVEDGGHSFVLTMVRLKRLPEYVPYLVQRIQNLAGQELWTYQESLVDGFDGFANLAKANEHTVIALTGKGPKGKVLRVAPLTKLVGKKLDLVTQIELKRQAAKYLGREYELTSAEQAMVRITAERLMAQEEMRRRAEEEQRVKEREERVRRIMLREPLEGMTPLGKKRYGTPVVGNEWMSLPDKTYVIVVTSYNDETHEHGKLLESFQVQKNKGRTPTKAFLAKLEEQKAANPAVEQVKPVCTAVIEFEEGAYEVPLYVSMDAIHLAQIQGLNSGSYAAVVPSDLGGKVTVYAVHHDKIKTKGDFQPLAVI